MSKHDAAYIQACQQEDAMPDKQEVTTKEMSERLDTIMRECSTNGSDEPWCPRCPGSVVCDAIRARLAEYDALQLELGLTAEQNLVMRAELEDLREKRDALRVEVARFKAECLSHFRGKDGMGTCGPKCQWYQGEGKACPMSRDGLFRDLEKAQAALEAARPLIEAADKAVLLNTTRFVGNKAIRGKTLSSESEKTMREAVAAYRAAQEAKDKVADPFANNLTPEERAKEEEQLKYDEMERRHEQSVEAAQEKEKANG